MLPPIEIQGLTEAFDSVRLHETPRVSATSLLNLPPEVRLQIWELCLGQNYIHVSEEPEGTIKFGNDRPDSPITHRICRLGGSDFAVHDNFCTSTDSPIGILTRHGPKKVRTRRIIPPGQQFAEGPEQSKSPFWVSKGRYLYMSRHWSCLHPKDHDLVKFNHKNKQIDLGLMRTCKLIYCETFETVWSHNTFAFEYGDVFSRFIEDRTNDQRQALRHLVLNLQGPDKRHGTGLQFYPPAISKLSGIESVFIATHTLIPEQNDVNFFTIGATDTIGLDAAFVNSLRAQPKLHTVLTNIGFLSGKRTKKPNKVRPIYYRDDGLQRDMGQAVDCKIMYKKNRPASEDVENDFELRAKLRIPKDVVDKRKDFWQHVWGPMVLPVPAPSET
ncbi:hypothetical protein MMC10_005599 [Thelotrema lepadinum]|nr:hypothetical protein [Thelotrema lepadinum]